MEIMDENVLSVQNLVKNYGTFRAVNDISFVVPKAQAIGLLGPNGAGKTTTIQMLLGITLPNGGTISYFGKDFTRHRQFCLQQINFASSFNTLQGRISVYENLLVFAYLYNVKKPKQKILDLIKYFEIADLLNQKYWDLSTGQKTRVNIIKSLLNDPKLILMDEPTASLDPDIADKTLTLIEELKRERNLSLLFTSHNMDEVTRICDEVIFLDKGKIVAKDTPLNLTRQIAKAKLKLTFDLINNEITTYLSDKKASFTLENKYIVSINTDEQHIPTLIYELSQKHSTIINIEIVKPTLEDVFLQIARGEQRVN